MFLVTQNSSTQSVLSQSIINIQLAFGIYWPAVKWEDLLKPLYSALAARLYLQYSGRNIPSGIPRAIPEQANYWSTYYKSGSPYTTFIAEVEKLQKGCSTSNGADLVFVLDASGSIGSTNFVIIKTFVENIVRYFDIGLDESQYRVGIVKYSTGVNREFDLKTFDNQNDTIDAVRRITYTAGGTNTHLAIDEMVQKSYTETNGARPLKNGHPRVGIVVTDGQSTDPPLTVKSALRAHDADINMFAVGIGSSLNLEELDVIASDPKCVQRIILSDFTEVESLKYAIEKRTCEAPVIISPDVNSTIESRLLAGGSQNCRIKVPLNGTTIEILTNDGQATFYTSSSGFPSVDYYERTVGASSGRNGVIFLLYSSSANGTMYCNIKGDDSKNIKVVIRAAVGDDLNRSSSVHMKCPLISLLFMYFIFTINW